MKTGGRRLALVPRAGRSFLSANLTDRDHSPAPASRSAIGLALFWIAVSLAFGGMLWAWRGPAAAQQYLAGYLIELGLSVDNVFVFLLVFARFGIAPRDQRRVLSWGLATAVILRVTFVLAGFGVIRRFPLVTYFFGACLLFSGVRLLATAGRTEAGADPGKSVVARCCRRLLPMSENADPTRFFTVEKGRRLVTPLFMVLVIIETADFVFALDSLPAVLAVTKSGLVAAASNVFAVVALRSFYLVLHDAAPRCRLLMPGLAIILIFVGGKMLAAPWVTVGPTATLGIIAGILSLSLLASRKDGRRALSPRW
jgi:tellurite resistance protein TerC